MPSTETLDFDAMYCAFKRVKLSMGLVVDEVRITSKGAHLVREPFALTVDEPAAIEAELLQDDVQEFLAKTAPGGLQRFTVKMDNGEILVNAMMQVLVPVPVSAVCTLRIDEGKRLFIDLKSVNVLGGAPKSLVQKQLDAINPVFDLDSLPISGNLDSVEVADGKALLKGKVEPKLPSR